MAHAKRSLEDEQKTKTIPSKQPPEIEKLAQLFPELEIETLIGAGGMGAVYRVRQKNLDRVVALKVFLYENDDAEFAARFQREARALARLNHPNIVTVHDFGQRDGMHYLMMEFVDGLNLRQISQSEKLDPVEALEMVPQLCDALQFAHDQGVIHRDIKPENILLDVNGRIKIADFGLAKMTGHAYDGTLTRTQQVMGTLNYMAPEQRERPTEVDHRADIYSLGVVIYEMLTGELPFGRFQPPSRKTSVSSALDEVVMRALEKEPEMRYQQASEFKTGFEVAERQPAGGFQPEPVQRAAAGFAHNETAAYRPSAPVKEPMPARVPGESRWAFAIFGGCDKKGSWKPGRPQIAITMFGGTTLDLTGVESENVELRLFTMFGGTEVVIPRGASVDVDGFMMFGALDDSVVPYDGYKKSEMQVRVRAFGGFGGVEIRTPTEKEVPLPRPEKFEPVPPTKQHTSHGWQGFKSALVLAYRFVAFICMFGAITLFATSGMEVLFSRDYGLAGAFTLLFTAILFFSGQNSFRRIIAAGPDENDPSSIEAYTQQTAIGATLNWIALMFMFSGIAILLVTGVLDLERFRFVAFITGGVSIPFFWLASQVNEQS